MLKSTYVHAFTFAYVAPTYAMEWPDTPTHYI